MTSGVLVVDKPEGPTSHDIVQLARRLLRLRPVGHTGTLDPMATGVLVLCVGPATRLARFLTAGRKVYRARVRLGQETDTLDRTGRPLGPPRPVDAGPGEIRRALASLTGRRRQRPPSFSAKRIGGVRAHRLARSGDPREPDPVEVEVEAIDEIALDPPDVEFRVACSAGTYIRSLARELGEALGCGGHLTALRRLRSGEFGADDALPPERLRELARCGSLRQALIPLDRLGLGMPALTATAEGRARIVHGRSLETGQWSGEAPGPTEFCRLLDPSGALLAVVTAESATTGTCLQPRVVLVRPETV